MRILIWAYYTYSLSSKEERDEIRVKYRVYITNIILKSTTYYMNRYKLGLQLYYK